MGYLVMQGITKLYPNGNILANNSVDLEIREHEIHAVVGENGAGKTTLMKILYGLERPDSGKILLDNREVTIQSPLDADKLGIGMVHQHFKLIPDFSIAENVTLGIEPVKHGIFLNQAAAVKKVQRVIEEYGFDLDPGQKVSRLTAGQMQQVEIVKILYRNARLLILDEPTSVLTEQQIHRLFDTLRNLVKLGRTIIIITHKLDEVKSISDRVTVMRNGQVAAVRNTAEVDEKELSKLMIGESVIFQFNREGAEMKKGKETLELKNVTVQSRRGRPPLLDSFNLTIHQGEIVGAAGVAGNGLDILENVVSGLIPIDSGTIKHDGKNVTNLSTYTLRKQGLAYVPADRQQRGASLESSLLDNMIISTHHSFMQNGVIRQKEITNFGNSLLENFSIKSDLDVPIGTLSGGNIQKVILARELAALKDFILFSEPTWGLDIASSQFVYENILACRRKGKAILLISSNLEEILGLADTIIVLYRGRIAGRFPNNPDLSRELIGEYMLGLRDDFKEGE